ncbi:MAG TPA: hypothetical protein VHL53_05180 [Acidimicrobiia bacterium]|nr:hypothetical protein [Acidimicrobiia bacterium]
MVVVLASLRNAFALRNLSQEPGRFFISLLLCVICGAIFMVLVRRPKPEEPPTWAQSMLGALAVFALFLLIYGVVPHEWLTWSDSKLGLREDKILLNTRPIKFSGRTLRDIVAATLYIIFLGLNTVMWIMWQKRGTAKPKKAAPAAATPEPAGTSAFSRPVTKKD